MPNDSSAWNVCKDWMRPDGALRDILVSGTSSDDWDTFIAAVNDWEYPAEFTVGGEPRIIPSSYAEVKMEQQNDPTLLRLTVGSVLVHCHFFPGPEMEFDIDPRDVQSHVEFNQLVGFIRRLGQLLDKSIVLTVENSPELPILQYEPRNDTTKLCPPPKSKTE